MEACQKISSKLSVRRILKVQCAGLSVEVAD